MNYQYIILILFLLFTLKFFVKERIVLEGNFKNKEFEKPSTNKLNFLWSKGVEEKNEYSLKDTESLSTNKEIIKQMKNNIVWIRMSSKSRDILSDIDLFSNNLNNLNHEIILVTSDGDKSIPSDIKKSTFDKNN